MPETKKEFTEEELNQIAGQGMNQTGFYSWQTVYEAFLKAGLSKEEAEIETDKRVWLLD